MIHRDIEVTNVTKAYGSMIAVRDVSFAVQKGHVVSLLGPSGCGKTTIMRMIAGLIEPTDGDIAIKGRSVARVPVHRRNIGMLFQNYALFPHLNVADNVAFGLRMRRLPDKQVQTRVADALAMVRLDGFAERLPHALSGGQQQRVALARALVIEPSVLLLDEPFGALDKKLRDNMQIELRQLQQRLNITTLMVTHDQDEALTLSDRIAVMRDGRIEQFDGPGEIYENPATKFVAGFIGTSNFFEGRVASAAGGSVAIESSAGVALVANGTAAPGDKAVIALRPESIRVLPAEAATEGPNRVPAVIETVIYRGINTQYILRMPNGEPLMVIRQNDEGGGPVAGLGHGASVIASWDMDRNKLVRDDA
ncbi:MAG: ABC transporter ATP-binding protein [Acetobacteraceae bacterium]